MVPAPGERSELGGGRQSIGKFRSTDMVRLALLAHGAALNDLRNLSPFTPFAVVTRGSGAEPRSSPKNHGRL